MLIISSINCANNSDKILLSSRMSGFYNKNCALFKNLTNTKIIEINGKNICIVPGITLETLAKKLNTIGIRAQVVSDDKHHARLVIRTKGTIITIKDHKGVLLDLFHNKQIGSKDTNLIQIVSYQRKQQVYIKYFGPNTKEQPIYDLHISDQNKVVIASLSQSINQLTPKENSINQLTPKENVNVEPTHNHGNSHDRKAHGTKQELAFQIMRKIILKFEDNLIREEYTITRSLLNEIEDTVYHALKRCDYEYLHHIYHNGSDIDHHAEKILWEKKWWQAFTKHQVTFDESALSEITDSILDESKRYMEGLHKEQEDNNQCCVQ